MKIVLINYSGNVGKTTVARHLLAPRLKNAEFFDIETINADGEEGNVFTGKQFQKLSALARMADNLIVDVGASNVEEFMERMKMQAGSHEDFDLFLMPVTVGRKQQRDTAKMMFDLIELGVPKKKIAVVFNMVERADEVPDVFNLIFATGEKLGIKINEDLAIHENEVFTLVGKKSLKEILDDGKNYMELMVTAKTVEEKRDFSNKVGIKRLAVGASAELDNLFKLIVKS